MFSPTQTCLRVLLKPGPQSLQIYLASPISYNLSWEITKLYSDSAILSNTILNPFVNIRLLTHCGLVKLCIALYIWLSLIQVMFWPQFGTNPLAEPVWYILSGTMINKLQWNLNWHATIFPHIKTEFEKCICKITALLSTSPCGYLFVSCVLLTTCEIISSYSHDWFEFSVFKCFKLHKFCQF